MKAHGPSLSINEPNRGGTNLVNAWKGELTATPPPPVLKFDQLKSWPARAHERQREMDNYRNLPSKYV